MTATLKTGRQPNFPVCMRTASQNRMLFADGIDKWQRWNGQESSLDTAGVAAPASTMTMAASITDGTPSGVYYAYVRFIDQDGNPSNLIGPIGPLTLVNKRIVYSQVPTPTETKVRSRQILRTLSGNSAVAYVDVDTTDLATTTFTSNVSDDDLSLRVGVTLLDSEFLSPVTKYTVPPANKAVMCQHLSRMFAAVERDFSEGHCEATLNSTTIRIVGGVVSDQFEDREIYIVGAPKAYTISSVSTTANTVTISEQYAGETNLFAEYAIKSAPANRRLLAYSLAGAPEAWPPTNALTIQETGDEITGLISEQSFLFILETARIHKLSFVNNPATDGRIYEILGRGCINNRCWVVVENMIYMLDYEGIHAWNGGDTSEPISTPIQDMFRPGGGGFTVNWKHSKWFHASCYPSEGVIRWFVSLSGDWLPRHAIAYSYRFQAWWIEEYPILIGSSVTADIGLPRVIGGSDKGRFLGMFVGCLDGTAPGGTIRGQVDSAGVYSITDHTATFPESGVVNYQCSIVAGRGKGQRRTVQAVSGTTLTMKTPWTIKPDVTSIYQLGGVRFQWRSGDMEFVDSEEANPRKFGIGFKPMAQSCIGDLELRYNHADDAEVMEMTDVRDGYHTFEGQSQIELDLARTEAYAQYQFDGGRESNTPGKRFVTFDLSGTSTRDKLRILQADINGVG